MAHGMASEPPLAYDGSSNTTPPQRPKTPQWPAHNTPRVWFLTDGLSATALNLTRHLLSHGDYIVVGVSPRDLASSRDAQMREFMDDMAAQAQSEAEDAHNKTRHSAASQRPTDDGNARIGSSHGSEPGWKSRYKVVAIDGRSSVEQCQSAIADALETFERIDILLLCKSEALAGSTEELDQTSRTLSVAREQFETNFFGPVNIIKALLPSMRDKRNGHIIALTGLTAHLGTPGLGVYCSSQWALEGYCDSLAYEIAPFNIRMTIVQPNLEVSVLTNRITSVPPMSEYAPDTNDAPLSREILSGLLSRIQDADSSTQNDAISASHSQKNASKADMTESFARVRREHATNRNTAAALTVNHLLYNDTVTSCYPGLSLSMAETLVTETVFAITAIGGHDNPPARHIVGSEGVASVKEKLKTVSEELEDFLGVSGAVDIAFGRDPTGSEDVIGSSY